MFLRSALAAICLATPAVAGPTLVIEPVSGTVLYSEDADHPWHPASLTKLMTAYLAFEALRDGALSAEDKLTCTEHALSQQPSKIGLPLGGQLKVDLALKALIIKSANDIAVMLAERIAGSEAAFVERMNATAKRLGMSRTHFENASGLPDPAQVTTARDLATLARALLREFPDRSSLYAMPSFKVGNIFMRSHNGLLTSFPGADGMKTGFICASGYNVVASATRDGRRLVAVVLGERSSGSRTLRAASLIDHGFETYSWKSLFASSIEAMPADTTLMATPADMKEDVCPARPMRVLRKTRTARVAKPGAPQAAKVAAPQAAKTEARGE